MRPVFLVSFNTPWGGHDAGLSEAEHSEYLTDPGSVAARHLGVSKADYLEWIKLDGAAFCGATNRHGKPCGCYVSGIQLGPEEWRSKHRVAFCYAHQPDGE